ncbi:hypothetical protein Cgig2_002034 [Carnegiea gigantea]|uniref:Uncharacterized protein n=1 Tax=Carnegiea gigantea TaxID=171969 RepID=A0A9Q1GVR5_9CARY|nr:hypothetical protein Cgig2_002034 [Carnegiea gigantea]
MDRNRSTPLLLCLFLNVICWVLGEYGAAYGKYSASYITGKLCDVAEAYSTDDTVKAYAVTALMKIYAFEIAAGRPVDMLPECQSLIEQLSASHSTDLQQRAYELQAVLGLDSQSVENILPFDASCEDVEVDKDLSFLNSYVQQSLEKGAQPYIPEDMRAGIPSINNFRSQGHHEQSSHGLRFEAYELPKPVPLSKPTPVSLVPSTELVPVPEPSYAREIQQSPSVGSAVDTGSTGIKLRLDGVQKKWGKPSCSSTALTSASSSECPINGVSQHDEAGSLSSKTRDSIYHHKKVQVDPEKQKLAASLFGGISKTEKRSPPSHKPAKAATHVIHKSQETKSVTVTTPPPPPDLLDLGEPHDNSSNSSSVIDPFQQLEGLLEPGQNVSNASESSSTNSARQPDLMELYGDSTTDGQSGPVDLNKDIDLLFGSSNAADKKGHDSSAVAPSSQGVKGPNLKDALQKDSLVRQMGVNPTTQNPNLFKDLLG